MDGQLFHLINVTFSNREFDVFFPWWTSFPRTPQFLPFILPALFVAIFYFSRWRGFFIFVIGLLLTALNDVVVGSLIKPQFLRARPFQAGLEVVLRCDRPTNSSFPSGHSADAFFFATFLSMMMPKVRWIVFPLAFLTAYSRVYCGVHYPSDVGAAAIFGAGFAYLLVRAYRTFHPFNAFHAKD